MSEPEAKEPDNSDNSDRPSRKWYQQSIANLILSTTLIAAGLGVYSRVNNNAKEKLQVEKAKAAILSQDPNELSNALEFLRDIDQETTFGMNKQTTLLKIAINKGDLELCKKLFDKGADLNGSDDLGITPLHYTAASIVSALRSVDNARFDRLGMDQASPELTEISIQHYREYKRIYEWLIENGANKAAKNVAGLTPQDVLDSINSFMTPQQQVEVKTVIANAQSQSPTVTASR